MIRPLSEKDYNIAISIVNTNWKRTYSNYVNPLLLNEIGCKERAEELRHDFQSYCVSKLIQSTSCGYRFLICEIDTRYVLFHSLPRTHMVLGIVF